MFEKVDKLLDKADKTNLTVKDLKYKNMQLLQLLCGHADRIKALEEKVEFLTSFFDAPKESN